MRPDLEIVAGLVAPGSRVLDLGCGDGQLLAHLIAERGCRGTGVDSDPAALISAIRRGVPVIDLDLDTQLGEFADRDPEPFPGEHLARRIGHWHILPGRIASSGHRPSLRAWVG